MRDARSEPSSDSGMGLPQQSQEALVIGNKMCSAVLVPASILAADKVPRIRQITNAARPGPSIAVDAIASMAASLRTEQGGIAQSAPVE